MADQSEFLNPRSRYYGQVKPENLVFNANLQEFANRVSLICGLETNGKLTPEESYKQIKSMFKQLKQSKKQLGIGQKPFQSDSN
jgi:polyhydroxyalkanoate synthesis regulator phasin